MNLQEFSEVQKVLDEKIIKTKGLEGILLLDKKILALYAELGELLNEFRGFKFWSENQEPNTLDAKIIGNGKGEVTNPLLEEYVNCSHFAVSLGNDLDVFPAVYPAHQETNIEDQFLLLFRAVSDFSKVPLEETYLRVLGLLEGLGKMLGFTLEEVRKAYLAKNKVNLERQRSNY